MKRVKHIGKSLEKDITMEDSGLILIDIGLKTMAGWYKEIDLSSSYTALPKGLLMWNIFDFPIETLPIETQEVEDIL
jgi:hypothetical protein